MFIHSVFVQFHMHMWAIFSLLGPAGSTGGRNENAGFAQRCCPLVCETETCNALTKKTV